ncbi:MAG TPA: transketolase [Ruminiclostridium sp.]|nr:transketolase [Clostridiaceae bacterium]HAA25446.1 transketolase [Ruminiclostridium sp.]
MTIQQLEKKAKEIRLTIVKMVGPCKTGHFGGSCSIADVVAALYFHKMRHDPKNPKWPERDRLIFSKGHAAIAQYAALGMCGYFPEEEMWNLKELGCMLQGHPDMNKTPGVEANTGSLGQGLSISCGIAAGLKLDKNPARVYCIVGDGEMAEGQIWEAAMAASFYKLDNLLVILDHNKLQATGPIAERFNTSPVREKWEAFGWHTVEINGHDMNEIVESLDSTEKVKGKPSIIIAHTIKGKGIPFAENNAAFHNGSMTQEQFETACGIFSEQGVM